jgi:competence protein ComEA
MTLSLGKISAICFAGSLLLVGATTLISQTAPPAQATPPAAAAPADQPASAPVDEWPAGPGKQIFLQTCSSCHSAENVIGHNQDSSGWTDTLNQMIQNGAQGSDDDFSAVLQYLVTNFGPMPPKVNVNKATAMNFRSWLGMPEKEAEAIVAYRAKNGDYKSLDDLKKVPGVDPNYIDSEKDLLTFS